MAVGAVIASPHRGAGQRVPIIVPVGAGNEEERYLRALSLVGIVPAAQWTVRPFGPNELDAMKPVASHPWSHIVTSIGINQPRMAILSPLVTLTENSSFPFGFNDGPVWAGKGLTGVVSAGAEFRQQSLSVVLNPIAFLTQNSTFAIAPSASNAVAETVMFAGAEYIDESAGE